MRYKSASCVLSKNFRERYVTIGSLYAEQPGEGHGSKLLGIVLKTLDLVGLEARLTAAPFGHQHLSRECLVRLYRKFGFKVYRVSPKYGTVYLSRPKPILLEYKP